MCIKYSGGPQGQSPALFGWVSKHISGNGLCKLDFQDGAGVTRQPGTLEENGRMFWTKNTRHLSANQVSTSKELGWKASRDALDVSADGPLAL